MLSGQFYHIAGGEGTKRRLKSPGFEAKNRAFKIKRPLFNKEVKA